MASRFFVVWERPLRGLGSGRLRPSGPISLSTNPRGEGLRLIQLKPEGARGRVWCRVFNFEIPPLMGKGFARMVRPVILPLRPVSADALPVPSEADELELPLDLPRMPVPVSPLDVQAAPEVPRAAVWQRREPSLAERDSYSSTALAELLDRATHASIAKLTLGLSPTSLIGAYLDWATHLAASPGKRLQLAEKSWRKWMRLQQFAARCALEPPGIAPCVEPLPQDKRFSSPAWGKWPFSVFVQSHLLAQQWWHVATTGVPAYRFSMSACWNSPPARCLTCLRRRTLS